MRVSRALALFLALLGCMPAALTPANAVPTAAATPSPVDAALEQARTAMLSDPQKGLDLAAAAEAMAERMPAGRERTVAIASTLWLRSEAMLRLDNSAGARPIIARALAMVAPIAEPLKVRGDLLLSQGSLQMDDGQAAAALASYQGAFDVFQKLGEKRRQALALSYIAALYSSANDDGRAEHYYQQAAATYDGDPSLSLTLHNNRGNVLLVLERYAEAEAEYLTAIRLARQMDKPLLEARVLGNLARDQVEARQLDAAEATLDRGFALTQGANAIAQRRTFLATAARIAETKGDIARAERLIRECFAGLDLATTSSDLRTAHLYAYRIFKTAGDIPLAFAHLEALKRLDSELAKVATTTGAALMAAQFDYANQELRIANLNTEEARKSVEFQRTLFLGLGAATLIVILVLSFGLFTVRRSRNQVRAANVDLAASNVALEKALKAKTEFLATTSHEIRTPLNGILGMTQVMLSDPRLGAETRDRIGIVHGAGVTMRALVDDILDVAKMETGNLTVDAAPMDLCAVLKDVTRMWEEQARAKGVAFSLNLTHAPHWIVSDSGRLRQIVFNLLSNAIKFTERGGVSVRAVAEGEGDARRLKLNIADSGIGIPEGKREEIFELFKQVDAGTTRKFGGTGLGLTICRNLARALGGDISVESAEGLGSTFIVDLPLIPAEAPADAAAESTGTGTMLILDRNPIARSMLRTLLEPRVGTLKFIATPAEAITALGEGATTLVIDEATLKAAGDDPLATLRQLAEAAAAAGAASTILWMKPDAKMRDALAATGIGQIVEKPVTGSALIESLISGAEENSGTPGPGPLVSRAA